MEKSKFIALALHANTGAIESPDHNLAFGLIRITEATVQRIAQQQDMARFAYVYLDMSEVRYNDGTIFLVETKNKNPEVELVVEFVQEQVDSDEMTPVIIQLRDSIFQKMEIKWPDLCEARAILGDSLCYIAILGDYLEVETVADDYLAMVQEAMVEDGMDVEAEMISLGWLDKEIVT